MVLREIFIYTRSEYGTDVFVKAISNESTFSRLSYAERYDPRLALKIGR